tara:strand:- start:164 stop:409 length:246 start_codon:yes stop_codon:yes gene_type:complete
MKKGFSDQSNQVESNEDGVNSSKKGIAKILSEKKFTYTLPGKRQINVFGIVVLSLNFLFVLGAILFLKNPSFHDFIFNIGR